MKIEDTNGLLKSEALIQALKRDGVQIGRSTVGNKADYAAKVVEYYTMWSKCPGDNMSMLLCSEAYEAWKNA